MGQFKQEEVSGLIRNSVDKRDKDRKQSEYTAVLQNGQRVAIDTTTAKSLERRLDKDRSRMEKEGTRAKEREPERKKDHRVASEAEKRAFLEQFKRNR